MAYENKTEEPIVNQEPKELEVPSFSKKEIEGLFKGVELVKKGMFTEDDSLHTYVAWRLVEENQTELYDTDMKDGLYLITYGNNYAFVPVTKEALAMSETSPIKVAIPVIYQNNGSFRPGTLLIKTRDEYDGDSGEPTGKKIIDIRVVDNAGQYVIPGLKLSVYRTKLF